MADIRLTADLSLIPRIADAIPQIKGQLNKMVAALKSQDTALRNQGQDLLIKGLGLDPSKANANLAEISKKYKDAFGRLYKDVAKASNLLTKEEFKDLGFANIRETLKFVETAGISVAQRIGDKLPAYFEKNLNKLGRLRNPDIFEPLAKGLQQDIQTALEAGFITKDIAKQFSADLTTRLSAVRTELVRRHGTTGTGEDSKVESDAVAKRKRLNDSIARADQAADDERTRREVESVKKSVRTRAEAAEELERKATQATRNDVERLNTRIAAEKRANDTSVRLGKAESAAYVKDADIKRRADQDAARIKVATAREAINRTKNLAAEGERAVGQAIASGNRGVDKATEEAAQRLRRTLREVRSLQTQLGKAVAARDTTAIDQLTAKIVSSSKQAQAQLNVTWARAGKGVSEFSQRYEKHLNSLSYQLTHFGFQLTIFGAAAIGAFKAPLTAAKEFDRELGFAAAITGATAEEFKNLKISILDMSKDSLYSVQQMAEGVRTLAQAGFNTKQAMEALPAVLNFAAAGAVSLDEAAKIAFSTMTVFAGPDGIGQLPTLLSQFATVANKTNTDVKGLGVAMKYAAPLAKQLGYDAAETMAIIGQLSRAGIGESQAGTTIRNIFQRILTTSGPAAKALEKLGFTMESFINQASPTGDFKKMPEILDMFNKALAGLPNAERAQVISDIFRVRGAAGFLALLNQTGDSLRALTKATRESADIDEIAAKRADTLWGSLERLNNAFGGMKTAIGDLSDGPLKLFVEALREAFGAITTAITSDSVSGDLLQWGLIFVGVAGAIATVGGAITLLRSGMIAFGKVIGPVVKALGSLVGMGETTFTTVTKAGTSVTKVIPAFTGLRLALAGVSKALGVASALFVAWDVVKAVKEWSGAFTDLKGAVGDAEAQIDKFGQAKNKLPAFTKDRFNVLNDDEKRAAIRNLNEQRIAAIASLRSIENQIDMNKITLGLAPGTIEDLKKDKLAVEKELQDIEERSKYYRLRVRTQKESKQDVQELDDSMDALTAILLKGKKAAPGTIFDIQGTLADIDSATTSYLELANAMADSDQSQKAVQANASQLAEEVAKGMTSSKESALAFTTALAKVATTELSMAERSSRAYQVSSQVKIGAIRQFYTIANQAIDDFVGKQKFASAEENEIASQNIAKAKEARKKVYTDSIAQLDKLRTDTQKVYEKLSADIIKIEQNTQTERIARKKWADDLMGASDKLKGEVQKTRELINTINELRRQQTAQLQAGDVAGAEETNKKILELTKQAAQAQQELYADAFKKRDELEKQLAEKRKDYAASVAAEMARSSSAEEVAKLSEELRDLSRAERAARAAADGSITIQEGIAAGYAARRAEINKLLVAERASSAVERAKIKNEAKLKEIKELEDELALVQGLTLATNKYADAAYFADDARKRFEKASPLEKEVTLLGQSLEVQDLIRQAVADEEAVREAKLAQMKQEQSDYLKFLSDIRTELERIKALADTIPGFTAERSSIPQPPPQMARGGPILGAGNGDTVPILAQPGEFMLSRRMVSLFGGLAALESIRTRLLGGVDVRPYALGLPRYATGGTIQAPKALGAYSLDLNLTTASGNTRATLFGEKQAIEGLINALRMDGLTRR